MFSCWLALARSFLKAINIKPKEKTPKKKLIVPKIKQFDKAAIRSEYSDDEDDTEQVQLMPEKYIECIVARFLPVCISLEYCITFIRLFHGIMSLRH
jgi:hypothetical protein